MFSSGKKFWVEEYYLTLAEKDLTAFVSDGGNLY